MFLRVDFMINKANMLQVRVTQRGIKQVLTERYYSWRDAQEIATNDPEIDLSGNGPAYIPAEFIEEDFPEEENEGVELALDTESEPREPLQLESGPGRENKPTTRI